MYKKIMISCAVMMLACALVLGIYSYDIAQSYYVAEVEHKLSVVGELIRDDIGIGMQNKVPESKELNNIAARYGGITKMRITFIDINGKVLGDSAADYTTLENHSNRPEFIQAMQQGQGASTRYSASLHQYLKYVALKIQTQPQPIVLRLSIPIHEINEIREKLILYILIGTVIILVVAGALGLKVASKITKPIREMTAFSKAIAEGDFDGTLEIKSNDELGELGRAFDNMQRQLKKNIVELRHRNIEMETILNSMIGGLIAVDSNNRVILINHNAIDMLDIKTKNIIGKNILLVVRSHTINRLLEEYNSSFPVDEQKVMDIQYNEKYYKVYLSPIKEKSAQESIIGTLVIVQDITNVRKLEQMRSEFVSNVTHELKTPLTSIKGFIDTLKGGAIRDEEVAEHFLDIIDIEAERLSILIGDILELSEIETMKHDVRVENYDLKDIIKEVMDVVLPGAQKKNIHLDCEIETSIGQVHVNKDRLKQMLINLIDNAIKYNRLENGKVKVMCKQFNKTIEFHICDNGIGIPAQHIPRLFERFYRVDKGRSRNQGGTGLGLSIVKHIVQLYNGDIEVKSEEGKGTEFIVKLPIVASYL